MKRQIKQYRLEHDQFVERLEASQQTVGAAAVKDFAAAVNQFGDPNMPDHLQPVEKSDADELERKALRRVRRINSEHEATRKSSEAIGEWQEVCVCVCGCARAVLNVCVVAGELIAFTCVCGVSRVESQQGEA